MWHNHYAPFGSFNNWVKFILTHFAIAFVSGCRILFSLFTQLTLPLSLQVSGQLVFLNFFKDSLAPISNFTIPYLPHFPFHATITT